jgi:uncharacterized membrane protein YeaQ/YmgE (transglycosylase-associated protein family)
MRLSNMHVTGTKGQCSMHQGTILRNRPGGHDLSSPDVNTTKETRMNLIIWLVIGGVIGWVASMIMKTDAQQGIILNVVVGIVGALIGGWVISPLIGAGTINQSDFSLAGLFVSLVGAVILLAIVNLFRRGRVR